MLDAPRSTAHMSSISTEEFIFAHNVRVLRGALVKEAQRTLIFPIFVAFRDWRPESKAEWPGVENKWKWKKRENNWKIRAQAQKL